MSVLRSMSTRRLAIALFALACVAPAPAAAGTILVKFAQPSRATAKVAAAGDTAAGETANHVSVVELSPGESVSAGVATYNARPDVAYAEPNYRMHALDLAPPDDPAYDSIDQWGLFKISALVAWSIYPGTYSSTGGVPIAVVDTGVQADHEDLAGRVRTDLGATCELDEPCFADAAADDYGHGTHVAGIAGAATNNAFGVAGVAFSSPIIPVKVLDSSGAGSSVDVANGIIWAAQKGAKVINLSLGGPYSQTDCDAAFTAEHTYGALVVASAGNSNSSSAVSPAGCAGVVGVAATDDSDAKASFSNYGAPDVFVSAPGVSILSSVWPDAYEAWDGTSMAAPFVTGIAALRFGAFPSSTAAEVRRVLAASSTKVGTGYGVDPYATCDGCTWSSSFGYGRVDALSALTIATPAAPTPPPPPPPAPAPPAAPPPTPPPPPAPPPPPTPAAPPADVTAPTVRTFAAAGRRRGLVKLRYRVQDDRRETAERILVYRGRILTKTYSRPLRTTESSIDYWVSWRAPRRRFVGRFCVQASDRAGNKATSCAALRVR
jgi:subtilisin family serine protease